MLATRYLKYVVYILNSYNISRNLFYLIQPSRKLQSGLYASKVVEGAPVGDFEDNGVGILVGCAARNSVGDDDGLVEAALGSTDGRVLGVALGVAEGVTLGLTVGSIGDFVGEIVGEQVSELNSNTLVKPLYIPCILLNGAATMSLKPSLDSATLPPA